MTTKKIVKVYQYTVSSGKRYEDQYGEWLKWFKEGAEGENVCIDNPPWSWVPILSYFKIGFRNPICYSMADSSFEETFIPGWTSYSRTRVEATAALRPELVDALWKYDCEWKVARRQECNEESFVITNNNSFYRPEMKRWIDTVSKYNSKKKKAVIVPCAADKPYPALLHKLVRKVIPKDWEILVSSGVAGIAPEGLWNKLPNYDSGIPNEWRLMNLAKDYFMRNKYDKIVVYVDFYGIALAQALLSLPMSMYHQTKIAFVNPLGFYYNYLDLTKKDKLEALKRAIKEVDNDKC